MKPFAKITQTTLGLCLIIVGMLSLSLSACGVPNPPARNIPTSPAVLLITPAPTLDIDATATVLANQLRPTPTPAGLYIVQDGDTLSGLAEQFDTTVQEILVANGLTDPNALQGGQPLIIPSLLQTPVSETSQVESNLDASPVVTSTSSVESNLDASPVVTSTSSVESNLNALPVVTNTSSMEDRPLLDLTEKTP